MTPRQRGRVARHFTGRRLVAATVQMPLLARPQIERSGGRLDAMFLLSALAPEQQVADNAWHAFPVRVR